MAESLFDKPEKLKTSFDVVSALRCHYTPDAYAFFEQVGNSTGGRASNWADCVVVGLWPSRGLDIVGIEVKVSRQDWLSELKNPKKAEAVAKFCDYWYLAVGDADIVREGELPTNWGLYVPRKDGRIHCAKAAVKNETPELSRGFIAAVLRRASAPTSDELSKEFQRGYEKAKKEQRERQALNPASDQYTLKEYNRLVEVCKQFEQASGVELRYAYDGKKVGEAVRLVLDGERVKQRLEQAKIAIDRFGAIHQEMKNQFDKATEQLSL
jgi:hypothetical protein